MKRELEQLEFKVKRKYSFKYKPEFSESFKTDLKDNQIIPLAIEVFETLDWPVVFRDQKSVEAKKKNNWNKATEKITITKKASGRIEVHSKTIEGRLTDFGINSKRTGLFIALFKKLETEFKANGQLAELEKAYETQNSWADYEVPTELPPPKTFREPSFILSIAGGLTISIVMGILIAFLSVNFVYLIGFYELIIGFVIGYLFAQVLKATNYLKFRRIEWMLGGMMVVMFITNQFTQYLLIVTENNISGLSFFDFMTMRIDNGLTIKTLNTGWIGLILSWVFQMVFPYLIAANRVAVITASYIIGKVPEKVIEFTIYLFEMNKPESEVRAELAQKGWTKTSDQNNIIQAIVEISGFHQMNRD